MSNFRELVKEFGASAGVPGLELDSDGLCRIIIDGSTTIDLELDPKDEVLLLSGPVLPDVGETDAEVFATALVLNMNIGTNKGSFLAFDDAGDALILVRRLDNAGMRSGDFEKTLNEFVAYAGYCRDTLTGDFTVDDEDEDGDQDDAVTAGATPPSDTDMVFRL